jgi:CspA family cold shock protein
MWIEDEGWGVIDSQATPTGCWAHFSVLSSQSFWEPQPGEPVEFDWESADQDGFTRRVTRVWPAGTHPVDQGPEAGGAAYRSHLSIDFD